jgi:hypothetical protein
MTPKPVFLASSYAGAQLSQRAPFFFFGLRHSANGPHHERAVEVFDFNGFLGLGGGGVSPITQIGAAGRFNPGRSPIAFIVAAVIKLLLMLSSRPI